MENHSPVAKRQQSHKRYSQSRGCICKFLRSRLIGCQAPQKDNLSKLSALGGQFLVVLEIID
jgi:hypothetical protein